MKPELKALWNRMLPATQNRMLRRIAEDPSFPLADQNSILEKWINGDQLPEKNEYELKIMFHLTLLEEIIETKTIIEAT